MSDTLPPGLAGILDRATPLLADGAANPGSRWRNLALGSIGLDGTPQVRTVVLRRFDAGTHTLDTHTDTRSAKHAELQANPAATLHGWDAESGIQLRVSGVVGLHTGDEVARNAWAALREASRATYLVDPGPGTRLATPDAAGLDRDDAGFGVFCVLRLQARTLEYLQLGKEQNQRAKFTWADGGIEGVWLVP